MVHKISPLHSDRSQRFLNWKKVLLSGVCALSLGAGPLSAGTLSLSNDGVGINVDGVGKFTLKYPQLLDSAQKSAGKLIEKQVSGSKAHLKYDGGTEANVSVSGDKLTVEFAPLSGSAKFMKMEMHIAFTNAMGAKWRLGSGEFQPFPEEKPAKPHLFQANQSVFEFASVTGKNLSFRVPEFSFQQLTDCREWNWKNFIWFFTAPVNKDNPRYTIMIGQPSGAEGAAPGQEVAKAFIMDKFGQYVPKEWPGKVKSEEELKSDIEADKAYYGSLNPPEFDKYGGFLGSKERFGFQQTGFFHVEKKDGRWYMVDPEGNWFFHLGVCSFQPYTASTYYQGRENIYEWIPPYESEFKTAFGQNVGGTKDGQFNFLVANRIRKYGAPHDAKAFTAQMIERVRKFGFNSAGAFGAGDAEARKEANFPYVNALPLGTWQGVTHLPGIRETWDPFDEKTRAAVEKCIARLEKEAGNPLLIGYFLVNEPLYEDIPKAVAAYKEDKACKRRLVAMLEEKHKTIDAFNRAWNTQLASFEEAARQGLPVKTKEASADMDAFQDLFLEEYFKFTTETFRKYDKNHMLLGCRLQSGTINNESLCRIGGKYMDVWSFNYYTYGLDEEFLKKIEKWTGGKPMILSEFYWNSFADSGVSGGVKDVKSQEERGLAFRHYVEHAATLPFVVGVEWFTLLDASQTGVGFGKYNGENPNSGLISVTDRPWKKMIEQMVKTNYEIYKVAAGERPRFIYDDPRFTGQGEGKNSVVAYRTGTPLQIDGQASDWPGQPAERIGTNRLVQGSSADGFEGAFKVCWDDTYLYLLVDVADKTPMKNDVAAEMLWSADGVEVFFGSEELEKSGQLLFTDRQILLSASKTGKERFHYAHAPMQYECKVEVSPKEGEGGYILEAAIPWKALECKPAPNKEFIFDLALDDCADGKRRDRQLMWSGTGRNSGDRSKWGRMRLAGQ